MPLKNLTEEEKKSTVTLLAAIECKDKRFRLFQTAFMVSTFILLSVVIIAQNNLLNEIRNQSVEQAQRQEDQQQKIIRRLNCIVVFFSERNRADLSIEDVDRCVLNRNGNVQQFFEHPEPTDPQTTPSNSAPVPSVSEPTSPRQAPTTSSPPPDDTEAPAEPVTRPPEGLRAIPLVDGLLNTLGL